MAVVYFMSMETGAAAEDPLEAARETIVNDAVKQFQIKHVAIPDDPNKPGGPEKSPVELAREMMNGAPDRQVPLKQLKDNPFVLTPDKKSKRDESVEAKKPQITPGVTAVQRAEALRLQSIVIANGRSLAIISDRLLAVGQEIAGWKVHEIGKGQVTLKRKDLSYVLRVKQ
jgi:hypothetical protein